MEQINNIYPILDKTIIELIEDYYYNHKINISPVKINPLFDIPILSYIYKPIKDCTIAELCYSGDKHNIIFHIISKYQIDIYNKNSSLPININSKYIYDSYKIDIQNFLNEFPCNYYTFIYHNFINNPKFDIYNIRLYILHSKYKYLEDKYKSLYDKYKTINNNLSLIETKITKIFYLIFILLFLVSFLFIIK